MTQSLFAMPGELLSGSPILFHEPQWLWGLLLPPLLVLLLPRGVPAVERVRNFLGLGLRILLLWAVVLAVARPYQVKRLPDLSLTVVQDGSESMSAGRVSELQALAQRYVDQAQVPVRSVVTSPRDASAGTDLTALIAQGVGAAPPARSRRLLLLTDGADTVAEAGGNAVIQAAAMAGAAGVRIYPLAPAEDNRNLGIHGLQWPVEVRRGETVQAVVHLYASAPGPTAFTLRAGEDTLATFSGDIAAGTTEIPLEFRMLEAGDFKLELSLDAADAYPQDDRRQGWIRVRAPGPVLVSGPHAETLRGLLRSQGLPARKVEGLPKSLPANATLLYLGPDMARWRKGEGDRLAQFVLDGGDLILGGGPSGLGGDDPSLERFKRAMPVEFPNKRKRQPPPLAVVYVVDRSDSMGRENKLSLAVAAVEASVEMLSPEARVGVVAFADRPQWVVPLTRARNQAAIVDAVAGLGVAGGTEIYPALEEAWMALQATDATLKHIILLTDGRGTSRFEQNSDLVAKIAASQVSVSTVALSAEAARDELEKVAAAGGGRAWYTERFSDVPKIFIDETLNLLRKNAKQEDTAVRAIPGSRLVGSVDWSGAPQLAGHNPSKPKAAADLGLVLGDRSKPLLASWRYGRGSATVFASELGGGWSASWSEWGPQARWLGELVRAVRERPEALQGSRIELVPSAQGLGVLVRAEDAMGQPRAGLQLQAVVHGSAQTTQPLVEEVPGLYRGRIPWDGALMVQVQVPSGPGTPTQELLGQAAPPVPQELSGRILDMALLERIAQASGGQVLPSVQALLHDDIRERQEQREHWPWLLVAAVVLLLGEIGLRRLRLPERHEKVNAG
ncbi:MAG: VWA domain-containing protein [Myxococcota bacterium]|nr:VWA domain-containing protein [Myxococcota bacterium]